MNVRQRYLTTSLVLLALAFGYALTQGRLERTTLPRPAGVAPSPRVPPPSLPSASEILDRRGSLALDREQTRRLEALAREWAGESARLEAELQAAMAEFSRFMSESQAGRGTLAEIQQRSAHVGELGALLREQRRLHGQAAAGLLTDRQRQRLAHPVPDTPGGTR